VGEDREELSAATEWYLHGTIGGKKIEHDADHDRQLLQQYQPRVRRTWATLERN